MIQIAGIGLIAVPLLLSLWAHFGIGWKRFGVHSWFGMALWAVSVVGFLIVGLLTLAQNSWCAINLFFIYTAAYCP